MLTSRIAIYGTTRWHYIHRNLLFDVTFEPAGSLVRTLFENDVIEAIQYQWRALQNDDDRFLLAQIEQYGRRRHEVPVRWHYVPHSGTHDTQSACESFESMVTSCRGEVN